MEDEKFLGEPSNSTTNRSLLNTNNTNNNNNNSNNSNAPNNSFNNNAAANSHRPSSSTSSSNNNKHPPSLVGGGDESSCNGDEDLGWWNCSLCTYKNSADKFKCEICDLRRGTSTRKPRCNADTIVAQVVKQQEQIRQQTRAKPPKNRSSIAGAATSSTNDSTPKSKSRYRSASEGKNRRTMPDNDDGDSDEDESNDDDDDQTDTDTSVSSPQPKKTKKKKKFSEPMSKKARLANNKKTSGNNNGDNKKTHNDDVDSDWAEESCSTDVSESQPISPPSSSQSSLAPSHYSNSESSSAPSSPAISPEPTTSSPIHSSAKISSENSFKITPLEINGNLIKYSPPTSSGRTGLIIDKKRFTQHSVTVNEVTITFTEFATRQNKYIRKKKKRRDGGSKPKANNGNGKSRTPIKSEPKSTANSVPSNANENT